MSPYEILYIINGEITEEEQLKITTALEAMINKAGGKIISTENLGKKRLSYPIKKIKAGYYLLSQFELAPLDLKEVEKKIKLINEIIRFLIVKKEPVVTLEKPSKPASPVFKKEAPVFKKEETKKPEKKEKVSIEELDAKLDEILGDDITKE